MKHPQMGEDFLRPQLDELVINWHVTEACNYRCRYCYAKWTGVGRELIHDVAASNAVLQAIFRFFSPHNLRNPLRQYMDWRALRLNLAGGEPLLYQDQICRIIDFARQIGFNTSLITNGSRLTASLAQRLAPNLSMLGISLDSAKALTNQAIGREDRHTGLLDIERLAEVLATARETNPRLAIKVNTVVNALNCHEDMGVLICQLAPLRWKVLRMLPVVTNDLAVSNADFSSFVERHISLQRVMRAEDNADMGESYLMLDPYGRFFQNALGRNSYHYSRPVRAVGAANAFSEVSLSAAKFCARYTGTSVKEAA